MAIIYSLSQKTDNFGRNEILIRYKSGKFAARAKSGVYSSPKWYEFVIGNNSDIPYKGKKVITIEMEETHAFHEKQKTKLSKLSEAINEALKDENLNRNNSTWLLDCIDRYYQRGKYTPKIDKSECKQSFFAAFDEFLEKHKLSDVRKKNFRVVTRALKRFELYKQLTGNKSFILDIDTIIAAVNSANLEGVIVW